jgi:Putative Actinobacterial Holin-X, holin superfamily III
MADATVDPPKVTELLEDIGHDLKTIAHDDLELTRNKITRYLEELVRKASVALLGATVALIGLGMLCVVAVVALAPVIPALWLRLLIMAVGYMLIGGGATYIYARRLLATPGPDLRKQISEVRETAEAISEGLRH